MVTTQGGAAVVALAVACQWASPVARMAGLQRPQRSNRACHLLCEEASGTVRDVEKEAADPQPDGQVLGRSRGDHILKRI
jgi:hypothetical protein